MKRNTFLKIVKDVVGTLLVLIPAIILSIYMAGSQLADLSGIVLMVVSGIVGLIIAVGLIYSCVKYAAENNYPDIVRAADILFRLLCEYIGP